MKKRFLNELLRSDQTVFSFKELLLHFRTDDIKSLASKLSYYVKNGELHHIRRGLYAKSTDYNHFELATKILTPSYISFETVLSKAGIIFQHYDQIFVASYQSRNIVCDGQAYAFRTIKPNILTNTRGIQPSTSSSIASPERAFLDIIYRHKRYHFDNLGLLDWGKVHELLPIYGTNKSMQKRVAAYHDSYKQTKGEKS
jgi:hypothetical protein